MYLPDKHMAQVAIDMIQDSGERYYQATGCSARVVFISVEMWQVLCNLIITTFGDSVQVDGCLSGFACYTRLT